MKPFRIVSNGIPLYIAAFVRQHSHIPWCAPKHSIANWMCATMYWNAKLILHEICANGGGIFFFVRFFFKYTIYARIMNFPCNIFHRADDSHRIVVTVKWSNFRRNVWFWCASTHKTIHSRLLPQKIVANWIRYDKMDAKSQSNSNPFDVRLFSCKFIVICFAIFLEWQIPVVHFIRMRITFSSNVVTK